MSPTLEEVKKHFKYAVQIKEYTGAHFNLKRNFQPFYVVMGVIAIENEKGTFILWERDYGYAEIIFEISKADQYFIETLEEVRDKGEWDKNPRPKWSDGTPAHSKFITQKSFEYRIDKGEFPLISLRPTAIAGGWYDMEAIYQKQTNVIEEMHPSIQSWWTPFIVNTNTDGLSVRNDIGQTYGHTVKRYNLMNELLHDLQHNPYGRRHVLNLWQKQQMVEDPKALVPCAYETLWSVSENKDEVFIDLTLNQRSQDFAVTASINPMQYVMKGLAVCGHLSHHTGREHTLRKFKYNVQNLHIYDRHIFAIDELLQREPSMDHAGVYLFENKDFYDYTLRDFKIVKHKNIQPLSQVLEIAV